MAQRLQLRFRPMNNSLGRWIRGRGTNGSLKAAVLARELVAIMARALCRALHLRARAEMVGMSAHFLQSGRRQSDSCSILSVRLRPS